MLVERCCFVRTARRGVLSLLACAVFRRLCVSRAGQYVVCCVPWGQYVVCCVPERFTLSELLSQHVASMHVEYVVADPEGKGITGAEEGRERPADSSGECLQESNHGLFLKACLFASSGIDSDK